MKTEDTKSLCSASRSTDELEGMHRSGLTDCPNPLRCLRIGRLHFSVQMAQDYWATRDRGGVRKHWLAAQTIHAGDGPESALVLIIWRLSLSVAWLHANAGVTGLAPGKDDK